MSHSDLVSGCYNCDLETSGSLAPRDDVVHTQHWRVCHAFNTSLPGWLVVVPRTHVESFTELTPEAADELGGLVRRLSLALETVTDSVKTYLMQFSEAEGFSHLHLHLVPRGADHPVEARGPRVFAFMGGDEADWVSEVERDRISTALRQALSATA